MGGGVISLAFPLSKGGKIATLLGSSVNEDSQKIRFDPPGIKLFTRTGIKPQRKRKGRLLSIWFVFLL
jgi:hypothetical protein